MACKEAFCSFILFFCSLWGMGAGGGGGGLPCIVLDLSSFSSLLLFPFPLDSFSSSFSFSFQITVYCMVKIWRQAPQEDITTLFTLFARY